MTSLLFSCVAYNLTREAPSSKVWMNRELFDKRMKRCGQKRRIKFTNYVWIWRQIMKYGLLLDKTDYNCRFAWHVIFCESNIWLYNNYIIINTKSLVVLHKPINLFPEYILWLKLLLRSYRSPDFYTLYRLFQHA